MTYEQLFRTIKEMFMKADVSNVSEHLAFQFNITGEIGRASCRERV